MNSYERVVTALNHQEPDRVPVYPILAGITRKLVGASYENGRPTPRPARMRSSSRQSSLISTAW